METHDSSSSLRQDNGRAAQEPCEMLHPGDSELERAAEEGPNSEDDRNPASSSLKMDASRGEIAARQGAMNASTMGGVLADGIPCQKCGASFVSLQAYMEHRCPNACRALPQDEIESDLSDVEDSDVETLEGEIVYQPNGSAFIIEDSVDSVRNLQGLLSSAELLNRQTSVPFFPQVISSFHIASSMGRNLAVDKTSPNTSALAGIGPVLHSFRVYDLRHGSDEDGLTMDGGAKNSSVSKDDLNGLDLSRFDGCVKDGKSKPVLMCFLCRMSFGYVRSFVNHAVHDHHIALNQKEQKVLTNKYVSAIIQGVGQDREPLLSFLEPKKPISLLPLFSAANPMGPDPSLHGLWSTLHTESGASLQAGFCSLKGSSSSASAEEESVVTKAKTNLGVPSPSVNSLSQSCTLSGTAGKSQESSSTHVRHSIKSEPREPAENEEDGGAYSSEGEEDDSGIGKRTDFSTHKDLSLLNQSISLLSSPLSKPEMETPPFSVTVSNDVDTPKHVPTPSDHSTNAEADGFCGSGRDHMKCQENATHLSLDSQRKSDDMSLTPQHHVPGKPGTPDTPSTGRGSPDSDIEYTKCDTVVDLSHSLGDHMTRMQHGNSGKTLKCPMCNWHYKHQQSLDCHIKEKHPTINSSCPYCGTGQPHPRLSRGESHTCGYKPFHCEVCNYSTTTKGNLTIHMQSDKHLHNVQTLQNGGVEMLDSRSTSSTPVSGDGGRVPSPTKPKQRSSWRCEVCDYETSVARNLRIHMTSEKHVHNVMLLQQTFKQIRGGLPPGLAPAEAQLYQYYLAQNMGLAGLKLENTANPHMMVSPFNFSPFAATGLIPGLVNDDLAKEVSLAPGQLMGDDQTLPSAGDLSPNAIDPPQRLYQCGVCNRFASDNLEALSAHSSKERVLPLEDWRTIVGDLYQCRLCGYSTQLRANFLLHCQTDRHLHRYQLAAHLKEAGEPNHWKLKDVNVGDPVHLKCNACEYHSNSIENLRRHTANQRHEAALKLYKHLQKQESAINSESCYFCCALCDYSTKAKLHLVQHLHSARHQQALGSRKLQLLQWGFGPSVDNLGDIFFVKDRPTKESDELEENTKGPAKTVTADREKIEKDHIKTTTESGINTLSKESPETVTIGKRALLPENGNDTAPKRPKSTEKPSSEQDQNRMAMHVISQHSLRSALSCPLCDDILSSKIHLQLHLTHLHSVAAECVEKLITNVREADGVIPQNLAMPETVKDKVLYPMDTSTATQKDTGKPQGGSSNTLKSNAQDKDLKGLQNVLELKPPMGSSDTPSWKRSCDPDQKHLTRPWKGQGGMQKSQQQSLVSDCYAHKHRRDQRDPEPRELLTHLQPHAITVCPLCLCSFHTVLALRKHLESDHSELSEADVQTLCRTLSVMGDTGPETEDRVFDLKLRKDLDQENKDSPTRSDSSSPLDEMGLEPKRAGPLRKGPNFLVEKFLDPSRPYKCTVCKESFTQKNILLVHYNSVSHLHKLKKVLHKTSSPVLQESSNSVDSKPYKCSICNVSYSQSSTLEIHMRSVLHQTKARTAKVETSSGVSSGNHGMGHTQSPVTVSRETVDSVNLPVTAPKDNHMKAKETTRKQTSESISALLSKQPAISPAQLQLQHDLTRQAAFFPQFLNPAFWPPLPVSPNILLQFQQPQLLFPFYVPGSEVKLSPELVSQSAVFGLPGMTGSLLEDLRVQQSQFQQLQQQATNKTASDSEVQQQQKAKDQINKPEEEQNDTEGSEMQVSKDAEELLENPSSNAKPEKLKDSGGPTENGELKKDQLPESPFLPPRVVLGARGNAARALLENFGFELVIQYIENRQRNQKKSDCAEEVAIADKLECGTCGKLFSNILILKNHQEHVHRQIFPNGDLEKFAQQYREAYDKLYPIGQVSPAAPPSPPPTPPVPLPPPPSSPQLPSQTAPTVRKTQTPVPPQAPQPPPTPPTPPPAPLPAAPPHLPLPTSLDLPFLLSMMAQHGGIPPHLTTQLPSTDSVSPSGLSILCQRQEELDPESLQQLESKRPRTRINDEQLKILRAHFNINSSPNEEKIREMAEMSGLQQKVIKHWFRNTLFKERQRSKDSPYNFNIPPVTVPEDLRTDSQFDGLNSYQTDPTTNKRSSRTRFTDHQMRVLRDFFETNAYPKDDEIDSLSFALNLPSRVIVIWFQNARQKARKTYECQADSAEDSQRREYVNESYEVQSNKVKDDAQDGDCQTKDSMHASKLPKSLEPTDLSKHSFARVPCSNTGSPSVPSPQSTVGKVSPKPKLTSENLEKSEDSKSQVVKSQPELQPAKVSTPQPARQKTQQELMTRLQSTATTCSPLSPTTSSLTNSLLPQMLQYECEKCKMTFSSAKLWQEHQRMHLLANQNQFFHSQFLERSLEMPYVIFDPSNPLITSQLLSGTFSQMPLLNNTIHSSQPASGATSLKRKFDDREDNSSSDKDGANTGEDQHRDKRPRTTITPEQLEILYDKYLLDSNPTRKMLDHIANTVGLKKRVVQVWFQNTRARERKGQFRTMGTALSHKKCTFCGSLFKATSALESHIRSSHWHEAKEAGFNLLSSPMISFSEGGESQQRYDENLPTKVENIEYEAPKYEQPAASSSLVKPSEGQLKQFVNPSCAKAENNCDSEGFSFNSADASVDLIKMDFDETSSVTTVTSDVSTGYKGQSEPSESKTNLLQNYDSYREYQFNQANFSIQDSRQSCSMQSDDLDDSTDQSETWSVVDLSSPHPFSYRNPLEPTKLSIDRPGHRRSRTQMSNQQVMILKACFSDCRTPTMHECETLGDKIGLAKRVVQVWFQNARAKEKKFKITVGKPFVVSQDSPDGPLPECTLCGTRFTTTFPIREHIFSKLHVDKLQETLQNQVDREKDHLNPTTVRQLMAQHEFERYKKRAMDSLGTTVHPQTVRDGSASLGLTWPTGYSGITGLPSDVNGPLKRPTFSQNTPAASPGDGSSQVTPSTAVSLSCTPAKNLLQTTPLPVSSAPLASQQAAQQNLEKPKKSEQPKPQSKQREANGSHSDFKKMEEGEGGGRTARKTAQPRGLLNTVPGDPGTFLAGQFLPYFVPGLVPYLPPQLPGFAQSGTFPPLYGMENMFPYGPGLPQAIAGLSPAALVQQYQQYQQSLPDKLQQQKPTERQRQKPVHTKLSKAKIDKQQPKEENAGVSTESTDQDPQTGVRSTDSPEAAPSSSVRGEFTCEKCLTVFTDKESVAHHQESCRLGRSSSESELCKVESSKYNSLAQNLAISKNKELSQHAQSGPNKDKAVKQAMRDAKEHTRLPHTACSSTTSTSQSINNNRPHISCTSMASWPSVLFQASSMRATSFLSPSAPLPSPVSTPSMVTSPVRGTSESRLSLPAEICSDKLGGELSQKLDNIENSLDIKTKATSGLNSNFRSIRMNMFTV